MSITRFVIAMFSVGLMVLGARVASSQDYPNKPIRIFTSSVGGGSDFVSRLISQGISGPLGQPVVVENRGGGTIAAETVAKATPDGYTLLVNGGSFYISSLLRKMPYDPVKDYSPITITSGAPNVLVIHPSLPVRSVRELIALAKARPGELNYASGEAGTASHLAGELFKAMAGINLARIAYKGTVPASVDLMRGEVQLMFGDPSALMSQIKLGRLRALAVTSAQQSALIPGLPTVAATVPGYEAISMTGVFAPAKTPFTIINRLNQEIVRVLKTAESKERILSTGSEVIGSSPEELAAWMKADMARMGKVIKDAGIKAD